MLVCYVAVPLALSLWALVRPPSREVLIARTALRTGPSRGAEGLSALPERVRYRLCLGCGGADEGHMAAPFAMSVAKPSGRFDTQVYVIMPAPMGSRVSAVSRAYGTSKLVFGG